MRDSEYVREIEERRARSRDELHGPASTLAAVARHEIPVGARMRFGPGHEADVQLDGMTGSVEIAALKDGFLVDGQPSGPRAIEAGRYRLRLSHQNYPAVVVLDAQCPRLRDDIEQRWYPIDPRMRLRTRLEPDGARSSVASTASADRSALRVGWLPLVVAGLPIRVAALRLLEPGTGADQLDVYFRDATTGHGSYEVGRYVGVQREGPDLIVDFNLAYNPACALSPFYNCPIPPSENFLSIPIRAGEMTPGVSSTAQHG